MMVGGRLIFWNIVGSHPWDIDVGEEWTYFEISITIAASLPSSIVSMLPVAVQSF